MQIAAALALARGLNIDRLDVQLMLAQLLQRPRSWLLAHDEHALTGQEAAWLQGALQRRAAGQPLAYVLGECEFCGLRLQISPAVLVPRPETELLVDWALQRLAHAPAATLLDLGTGSGAIALALKQRHPECIVTACDASGAALEVARANGQRHGLDVEWLQGDWWHAVQARHFGLAVSNPPYIAGEDPHLAALHHEPRAALTPEGDGMADLLRIIGSAGNHLLPGASLLLEHGHDQGRAVCAALQRAGFMEASTRQDMAGMPRCSGGIWPPSRRA